MSTTQPPTLEPLKAVDVPVYHYTNSKGLLGILQDKDLWASEVSSMNDLAEVRHGWSLVRRLLEEKPGSDGRDRLLEVPDWAKRTQNEVYVLSASTEPDDAHQWRNYAGNSGYAIALDTRAPLMVRSDVPNAIVGSTDIGEVMNASILISPWQRVLYDDEPVSAALDALIAEVPRIRARMAKEPTYEDAKVLEQTEEAQVWHLLSSLVHLIKAPGWRGENEVRITVTPVYPEGHIKHRPGASGITSYLDLTGATEGSTHKSPRLTLDPRPLPIVSVTLGPTLPRENAATVERLLTMSGLAAEVRHSNLSLR